MDSGSLPFKSSGSCSHCAGEVASYRCKDCLDGLDDDGQLVQTSYCNSDCQSADWRVHEPVCQGRRARMQLYRAGELLQAAFYLRRESVFERVISKVKKRGEDLCVWEGEWNFGIKLVRFPHQLVPDVKDKQMLLANLECSDSVACMHNLIQKALEDICVKIEELTVSTKGCRRQLILYLRNGRRDSRDFFHDMLRVTLADGCAYALDLTGAQFGHYDPIVPWDRYAQERVVEIEEIRAFGSHKECDDDYIRELRADGPHIQTTVALTAHEATKCLDNSTDAWFADQKTTLATLLTAPQPVYLDSSIQFLTYIAHKVACYIDWQDKNGYIVEDTSEATPDRKYWHLLQKRLKAATKRVRGSSITRIMKRVSNREI